MTKTDYSKPYTEYQDLKLQTHEKQIEVTVTVKHWFEENYPSILLHEVYINPRVHIDHLCLILTEKLPAKTIAHFCEDFKLEMHNEFYRIRREHNRTAIIGNPHVDFEEWRYSFGVKP